MHPGCSIVIAHPRQAVRDLWDMVLLSLPKPQCPLSHNGLLSKWAALLHVHPSRYPGPVTSTAATNTHTCTRTHTLLLSPCLLGEPPSLSLSPWALLPTQGPGSSGYPQFFPRPSNAGSTSIRLCLRALLPCQVLHSRFLMPPERHASSLRTRIMSLMTTNQPNSKLDN